MVSELSVYRHNLTVASTQTGMREERAAREVTFGPLCNTTESTEIDTLENKMEHGA
jgi:hypothetical protein